MGKRTCNVDECINTTVARGWCGMHYQRWRIHGDPTYIREVRVCSVSGCNKRHHAYGWCDAHYRRWLEDGSPRAGMPLRLLHDDEARFWQKVDTIGDCWLWTGAINSGGYGSFRVDRQTIAAYRWAYINFIGPIPEDREPDHLCRVRRCVNPQHLELVTRRENMLRGISKQAENARKTHCPQGHHYDEENTRIRAGRFPGRICKICESAYKKRKRREEVSFKK